MRPLDDDDRTRLAELLAALEADGVADPAVLAAIENDPALRGSLVEQLSIDRLMRRREDAPEVDLTGRVLAELVQRDVLRTERTMAEVRRIAGEPRAELAPTPVRSRGAIALISDIHANFEALQAVLADIVQRGIHEVLCLGDIIGYGPNPRECLEATRATARFSLLGNHEEAVLFHAEDFNAKARRAIDWTRDQLNASPDREANFALWDFLGDLVKEVREGEAHYVHGSPRQPTREYVLPNDIRDAEKMSEIFDGFASVCFCGHTHIPGVFTAGGTAFTYARQIKNEYATQRGQKVLVNVGSVGQPRDADNRACYVTVEEGVIRWHRVPYDFAATMAKIRACDALADLSAERLRDGR